MQTNSEQREEKRDTAIRLQTNVTALLRMTQGAMECRGPAIGRVWFNVKTIIGTTKDVDPEQVVTLPEIDKLLSALGPASKCRACKARIHWITSKKGKRMPIQADALSHFAGCPHAYKFKRKGGNGV